MQYSFVESMNYVLIQTLRSEFKHHLMPIPIQAVCIQHVYTPSYTAVYYLQNSS